MEALAIVWEVEYFRCYIYGTKFTIITDHNPLIWLMETKSTNSRVMRWSLKLQCYDFTIQHKPGKVHSDVDPLSRIDNHRITVISTTNINTNTEINELEQFKKLQRSYVELIPIIKYLEFFKEQSSQSRKQQLIHINKDTINQENINQDSMMIDDTYTSNILKELELKFKDYKLINGILYCQINTKNNNNNIQQKRYYTNLRLVISTRMQQQILHDNHDNIFAGHLGVKKTYTRIASKYYWKGLYQHVKNGF